VLAHTIPIYALYSLLFVDAGLSAARVSVLFSIWSVVGIIAEVPSGALADRFSRRNALIAATALQGCGHAMWMVSPNFVGFAVGFALWGAGGSLSSGSFEALVYDGLAATGAQDRYARLIGLAASGALLAQIPASVLASVLFAVGGYGLVGWSSVGVCMVVSVVAAMFPDHRIAPDTEADETDVELGYFATLRAGVGEVVSTPSLRRATIAVALIFGLDAIEEYFPLQVQTWGVHTQWVPIVVLTIPLAGAVGAGFAGAGSRLGARPLAGMLAGGAVLLGAAAWLSRPVAVVGIVAFYGPYRLVLSVAESRLQGHISGTSRATVTSVAALGGEVVGIAAFGVWALGGLPLVAAAVMVLAVCVMRWMHE
jgi:MFS family permease